MVWFGSTNTVNQTACIHEGNHLVWSLYFNKSTTVNLNVQRLDGWGIDVFVVSDREYKNFQKGLIYKILTDLSFYSIDNFSSGNVTIPRGRYFLIAQLQEVQDGENGYSEFAIRFEELT